MAMDVGVVTIQYLDRPQQPVSDFLNDLLIESLWALEDPEEEDEEAWGGGWSNNGFLEFSRSYLDRRVKEWADRRNAGNAARAALLAWVANLPWKENMIMLHLGG